MESNNSFDWTNEIYCFTINSYAQFVSFNSKSYRCEEILAFERLKFYFLEFFVNSQEFENSDRSVTISANEKLNSTFFILSPLDEYLNLNQSSNNLNSHILHLTTPHENLQITFRHLVSEWKTFNEKNMISFWIECPQWFQSDINVCFVEKRLGCRWMWFSIIEFNTFDLFV
jgi:hypothetical protein